MGLGVFVLPAVNQLTTAGVARLLWAGLYYYLEVARSGKTAMKDVCCHKLAPPALVPFSLHDARLPSLHNVSRLSAAEAGHAEAPGVETRDKKQEGHVRETGREMERKIWPTKKTHTSKLDLFPGPRALDC